MMPDNDVKSNEIIRPFVIVQPQYAYNKQNEAKYKKEKEKKWNPRIEAPNSLDFFKHMNKYGL